MALENTCVENEESDEFKMVCHGCSQELMLRGLEPFEEGQCPLCNSTFIVPHKFGSFMLQDIVEDDHIISIYVATDLKLQREVFVKVIDKDYIDVNTDFSKGLNIPLNKGIVTVYSSEFVEEGMLLVTENVKGRTLKQILADGEHLTVDEMIALIRQIAASLSFASANGVVHGNLVPASIWVTDRADVKVADFFLRTNLCSESSSPDKIARVLDVRYASPSKLKYLVKDEKSDLYSLGIIMYQLFTRALPFPAQYYLEAIQERQSVAVQNPRILNSNIPEDIAVMIVSLLTQDGTYNSFSDVLSFFSGRETAVKTASGKKSPGKGKKPPHKKLPSKKPTLKPKAASKPARQSVVKPNRKLEKVQKSLLITRIAAVIILAFAAILFVNRYFPSSSAGKASEQFLGSTVDKLMGRGGPGEEKK